MSIDQDFSIFISLMSDKSIGDFGAFQSMHAKLDVDLNQVWATRTNSAGEEFLSGDNVIIDDHVIFASMNVG